MQLHWGPFIWAIPADSLMRILHMICGPMGYGCIPCCFCTPSRSASDWMAQHGYNLPLMYISPSSSPHLVQWCGKLGALQSQQHLWHSANGCGNEGSSVEGAEMHVEVAVPCTNLYKPAGRAQHLQLVRARVPRHGSMVCRSLSCTIVVAVLCAGLAGQA